ERDRATRAWCTQRIRAPAPNTRRHSEGRPSTRSLALPGVEGGRGRRRVAAAGAWSRRQSEEPPAQRRGTDAGGCVGLTCIAEKNINFMIVITFSATLP